MMRRTYSRDHRPGCEQMVIALIENSEGLPFSMIRSTAWSARARGAFGSRDCERTESGGDLQARRAVPDGHAAQPDEAV
jgi:hypothetical protein